MVNAECVTEFDFKAEAYFDVGAFLIVASLYACEFGSIPFCSAEGGSPMHGLGPH
jgi:hypothetical protein